MNANRLPETPVALLTVKEAADRLALSVRSVRTLIALGRLPTVRVSARAVRVHPRDLERYIESVRSRGKSA